MINYLAERYKTITKRRYFNKAEEIKKTYAFIGTGSHARTHLYPVLQYLGVPLKYIFSRDIANSKSMSRIYKNCTATDDLAIILDDKGVEGVFVCTTPSRHFTIAQRLLEARKDLFIEKPPCHNLKELQILAKAQQGSIFHINLQQRYSPVISEIKKSAEKAKFYRIEYLTGLYEEKKALTELFIHPLDLVIHLFGNIQSQSARKINTSTGLTYLLQTYHESGLVGELKLSTAYSWQTAKEVLEIHTDKHFYSCNFPFEIRRTALPTSLLGVPIEKLMRSAVQEEIVFNGHNIATTLPNHTSFLYGFYHSIESFIDKVENKYKSNDIESLMKVFTVIEQLQLL